MARLLFFGLLWLSVGSANGTACLFIFLRPLVMCYTVVHNVYAVTRQLAVSSLFWPGLFSLAL